MSELPPGTVAALRLGATACGAAAGLIYFSLLVWTARDISSRSRDGVVRLAAVALVALLNAVGLVVYVLLRPQETLSERYEREMIEEILARELSAGAVARGRLQRKPGGQWALATKPEEE